MTFEVRGVLREGEDAIALVVSSEQVPELGIRLRTKDRSSEFVLTQYGIAPGVPDGTLTAQLKRTRGKALRAGDVLTTA